MSTLKQMNAELPKLVLKPGKERSLHNRHPWVFSGAIAKPPKCDAGAIIRVESSKGEFLGIGYYNAKSSIACRILSWKEISAEEAIRENIASAGKLRASFLACEPRANTGYRLAHGEADQLPGLVIDRYGSTAVIQLTTLGMDRLRDTVVSCVKSLPGIERIVERSTGPSRREEGLADAFRTIYGDEAEFVPFTEDGIAYESDIE